MSTEKKELAAHAAATIADKLHHVLSEVFGHLRKA